MSRTHPDHTADTRTQICADELPLLCSALRSLSMVGLILIALGTGGIKPCVAAFGGDQFEDHQVRCHPSTSSHVKQL